MKTIKIIIDIVMTLIFILLMKISFIGINLHELMGLSIFFIFLVHKIINYNMIIAILKSFKKVNKKSKFMILLDIVLFALVTFIIVSGILISQTILVDIKAENIPLWSSLHHFASYTALVLLSVHVGLHWQMLMSIFCRLLGFKEKNPIRTIIARILVALIAVSGVKSLTKEDVYKNFLPFPLVNKTQITAFYPKRNNDNSTLMLSVNNISAQIPSLEEYLSKLFCTGCSRRCPLTNLQCSQGNIYKARAVSEYNVKYSSGSSSSQAPSSSNSSSSQIPNNSSSSSSQASSSSNSSSSQTPSSSNSSSSQIPNNSSSSSSQSSSGFSREDNNESNSSSNFKFNEDNTQSDSDEQENTSPFDYLSIMGFFIAGTHYTVRFRKK